MSIRRRDFVKTGAGAAIGATLWPGNLAAGGGATRPARKVRLGFIGVGGRGTWLLRLALQRDDCEVKAVCDIKPERVERARDLVKQAHGDTRPAVSATARRISSTSSTGTTWTR